MRGVILAAATTKISVDVSAYADDTAVMPAIGADVTATRGELEEFGQVCGLKINVNKSICVPLGHDDLESIPTATNFPILAPGKRCKYLDISVRPEQEPDNVFEQFESETLTGSAEGTLGRSRGFN